MMIKLLLRSENVMVNIRCNTQFHCYFQRDAMKVELL